MLKFYKNKVSGAICQAYEAVTAGVAGGVKYDRGTLMVSHGDGYAFDPCDARSFLEFNEMVAVNRDELAALGLKITSKWEDDLAAQAVPSDLSVDEASDIVESPAEIAIEKEQALDVLYPSEAEKPVRSGRRPRSKANA